MKTVGISLKVIKSLSLFIMQSLLYVNHEMVHYIGDIYSLKTRPRCRIDLLQVRLVKTDKKLMIIARKLFNKFPLEIRELNHKDFKIKFSQFLFKKYLYSLNE